MISWHYLFFPSDLQEQRRIAEETKRKELEEEHFLKMEEERKRQAEERLQMLEQEKRRIEQEAEALQKLKKECDERIHSHQEVKFIDEIQNVDKLEKANLQIDNQSPNQSRSLPPIPQVQLIQGGPLPLSSVTYDSHGNIMSDPEERYAYLKKFNYEEISDLPAVARKQFVTEYLHSQFDVANIHAATEKARMEEITKIKEQQARERIYQELTRPAERQQQTVRLSFLKWCIYG